MARMSHHERCSGWLSRIVTRMSPDGDRKVGATIGALRRNPTTRVNSARDIGRNDAALEARLSAGRLASGSNQERCHGARLRAASVPTIEVVSGGDHAANRGVAGQRRRSNVAARDGRCWNERSVNRLERIGWECWRSLEPQCLRLTVAASCGPEIHFPWQRHPRGDLAQLMRRSFQTPVLPYKPMTPALTRREVRRRSGFPLSSSRPATGSE